jgi:hypothetical protein
VGDESFQLGRDQAVPRREYAVVLGAMAIFFLIAALVGGHHATPKGGSVNGGAVLSSTASALVPMMVGTLSAALVAVLVWMVVRRSRVRGTTDTSRPLSYGTWLDHILGIVLCLGLLGVFVAMAFISRSKPIVHGAVGSSSSPPLHLGPVHADTTSGLWFLSGVVPVLLFAGFVAIRAIVRSKRAVAPPMLMVRDEPSEDLLTGAAQAAAGPLAAAGDARLGVIAAYDAMRHFLAGRGLSPGLSETPREYLTRVLTLGGASADAAAKLTALFERAGFSRQLITEEDRAQAGEALRALSTAGAR